MISFCLDRFFPLCFAASLATTGLRVTELEANLKASNRACEDAQAKIVDLKAKNK
jgi:hypothetical protein